MASNHFTALIRLPFSRGNFEDPPQAEWDAEKDRQLWKVISKSSRTSDLDWVDLATRFQVPPSFLLQQAAWLYERHLDHVRNQMKKVSLSTTNAPMTPTGASTLTAGGLPMQRTGSGGGIAMQRTSSAGGIAMKRTTSAGGIAMQRTISAGSTGPRTTSNLSGRQTRSPTIRQGEIAPSTTNYAPTLSRTPSTNTITQSRAHAQQAQAQAQPQPPSRTQSTRSVQRPTISSPRLTEKSNSPANPPPGFRRGSVESPDIPASPSSSSSSSLSDADHPAHRSQLFKRPPRFKQQRPRELSTFAENDGTQEIEDSGSHAGSSLPFASQATRRKGSTKYAQDTMWRSGNKTEQKVLQADRSRVGPPSRQPSADQQSRAATETESSMTSSASTSDAPAGPSIPRKGPMSPLPNHRAELGRLGSPRHQRTKSGKEGSEGTPSMGSSFSDIDDAGISQSALEEALLSNMAHGRMSTLSRMSRFI